MGCTFPRVSELTQPTCLLPCKLRLMTGMGQSAEYTDYVWHTVQMKRYQLCRCWKMMMHRCDFFNVPSGYNWFGSLKKKSIFDIHLSGNGLHLSFIISVRFISWQVWHEIWNTKNKGLWGMSVVFLFLWLTCSLFSCHFNNTSYMQNFLSPSWKNALTR